MNSLPSAVHVSSTFESGAPRIDRLALFANSPFSTFIRSPMNLLPSVVHVSSTFEFGAMLHDCLSVDTQVQSFILHNFRSPMNVIS